MKVGGWAEAVDLSENSRLGTKLEEGTVAGAEVDAGTNQGSHKIGRSGIALNRENGAWPRGRPTLTNCQHPPLHTSLSELGLGRDRFLQPGSPYPSSVSLRM